MSVVVFWTSDWIRGGMKTWVLQPTARGHFMDSQGNMSWETALPKRQIGPLTHSHSPRSSHPLGTSATVWSLLPKLPCHPTYSSMPQDIPLSPLRPAGGLLMNSEDEMGK